MRENEIEKMNCYDLYKQNEMIALFMGYKPEEIQAEEWCGCNVFEPCDLTGDRNWVGADYHGNWSWLMPVVEKIGSMNTQDFNVRIQWDGVTSLGFSIWVEGKYYGSGAKDSWIDVVYEQVVSFIQWYNTQSKPE